LPDSQARLEAVAALAALGQKATSALPLLKELQNDENSAVREAAAEAARKIES
jgi:HEAT repeat protein